MRAIVYKEPNRVELEQVDDARIEQPTDALIRITTTGICGSDMHMFEGRTTAKPGTVLGHENMGIVEQVGAAVQSVRKGDRVVLPFNIACGFCFNCARGYTNACLTVNPDEPHAAYGYTAMGPFRGGQADLLRVPFADVNCLKLPGKPGDELEDDFLLLSDVFPTGYHATELAQVGPGKTVAVFGAGPVGLLAAYSAILKGASEVYVIDCLQDRLKKAQSIGAIAIDFSKGDPVDQIKAFRRNNKLHQEAQRPGEEKMDGVMSVIDAVGYEAKANGHWEKEKPNQVLENMVQLVNPTGHIGIVGVYLGQDPGGQNDLLKKGIFEIPLGKLFSKGVTIGMGQTPVKKYNLFLRDLIIAGRAKPSFIVSHRLALEEAPEAYWKFDSKETGYTKVLLKPTMGSDQILH